MLATLIRNLAPWRLVSVVEELLYPALLVIALVVLGHLTGLIAVPG